MNELNLPEPIAAYFEADRRDAYAVANCFTKDGVVIDEGSTYEGLDAIEAWKTAATNEFNYTVAPLRIQQQENSWIVTGRVTGNFSGSPVDLQYVFTLGRGKIALLEIIS